MKALSFEDHPDMRDLLGRLVEPIGYVPVTASAGEEGVEGPGREARLILLDMMMPIMDDWEVARRLRANPETKEIRSWQPRRYLGLTISTPVWKLAVALRSSTRLAFGIFRERFENCWRHRTTAIDRRNGIKVNYRKSVAVFALLWLCSLIFSTVSAYGQNSLDAQIQRLREGKKTAISDSEFLKYRSDGFDKFLMFAADFYIEQVKWSLISPETQGGWPYRSFVVESPEWIDDIYRNLKRKAEQSGESLVDYALICPALYLVDEAEVQRLLARLEGNDQFLYKQARENLDVWRREIAKRLRSRR
jgi:CheY-like chemotaxis protein